MDGELFVVVMVLMYLGLWVWLCVMIGFVYVSVLIIVDCYDEVVVMLDDLVIMEDIGVV